MAATGITDSTDLIPITSITGGYNGYQKHRMQYKLNASNLGDLIL